MFRRDFIKTERRADWRVGAAGLRGQLADMKKRVGLIGSGWYGKCDLLRLIQVAPVEVVSLCDVDKTDAGRAADIVATRQLSKKKPRTYARLPRDAQGEDLDIVLIATPDHWHALPMIAAVKAGADVYVQKPISVDVVEGQAMLAAARKYKRVVQVGTQRRSTPHLIEARDRIIKRRQARQDRPRRDLLLLPHAGHARIRPTPRRRRISTTRCGPARRRCGPTTRSCIRAAGARSWNTATASSATCASTCSTWCAGCSTSAGRRASARPAASWSTRRARPTSPTRRRRRSTSATSRSSGRIAPGAMRPIRSIRGARRSTATRARSRPASMRYDFTPPRKGEAPIHEDVVFELEQFPEDKTEKDLERHVAPAIRGHMKNFLECIASRGRPGRRHRARLHLDRHLHPRQPLAATRPLAPVGSRQGRGRRRRRSEQAPAPAVSRAVGASGTADGLDIHAVERLTGPRRRGDHEMPFRFLLIPAALLFD